ncbi:aspartyl-phosphate phosphatase Spo0E family protein [Ornithinibacillus gellani]|uniref:aspartyl-phosphate phosphatase Spo0E family protein n=1 Tax=Ornithinibacillus gellani TaxID=2293253 RepID=UPI000F4A6AAC|nr:aspartyl-phosphate phosphatase Spo0E family protein [Ornithinibacillus gellani]TQS75772.1 aspartyl-phosphate phosphatase Spo0E family protein [Ornithinibacillus gellani]
MDLQAQLEHKIEQLREKMYEAYQNHESSDVVLEISKELDVLLNKLDAINK